MTIPVCKLFGYFSCPLSRNYCPKKYLPLYDLFVTYLISMYLNKTEIIVFALLRDFREN